MAWQVDCSMQGHGRACMLRSARRIAAMPWISPLISAELILSVVVVGSFFFLLAQNQIPPLLIFLLELFLSA